MSARALGVLAMLSAAAATGAASAVAQDARPESLQRALGDDVAAHWIYGDFEAARKEAQKSKRPIFALFRCVP